MKHDAKPEGERLSFENVVGGALVGALLGFGLGVVVAPALATIGLSGGLLFTPLGGALLGAARGARGY